MQFGHASNNQTLSFPLSYPNTSFIFVMNVGNGYLEGGGNDDLAWRASGKSVSGIGRVYLSWSGGNSVPYVDWISVGCYN